MSANPLRALACTCDPMICLKFKLGPMMLAERGCIHRDARVALEVTRSEAFEEAAKVAENYYSFPKSTSRHANYWEANVIKPNIARAIRSLAEKEPAQAVTESEPRA